MNNQHSIMHEYEVYLRDRAREYQTAQANSEWVRARFGVAIQWLGSQLVTWGQAFQPGQNPPPSWVS